MPRRVSAILIADVVGYSHLVETDEVGTLAALKQRWKTILESRARMGWANRQEEQSSRL